MIKNLLLHNNAKSHSWAKTWELANKKINNCSSHQLSRDTKITTYKCKLSINLVRTIFPTKRRILKCILFVKWLAIIVITNMLVKHKYRLGNGAREHKIHIRFGTWNKPNFWQKPNCFSQIFVNNMTLQIYGIYSLSTVPKEVFTRQEYKWEFPITIRGGPVCGCRKSLQS